MPHLTAAVECPRSALLPTKERFQVFVYGVPVSMCPASFARFLLYWNSNFQTLHPVVGHEFLFARANSPERVVS